MPTIEQLAPAFAASDSDQLMVSQNGVARKITRSLLIAGLQPQISAPPGTLLGTAVAGSNGPSPITIGANLTLHGTTLSASAAPYVVSSLPAGNVPAGADKVAVAQGGGDAAVTYAQFMSGLSGLSNVNISGLSVTPTGSQISVKVADLAATAALTTGSAMTGPLVLSSDPSQPLQAATKQYVDAGVAASVPRSGGVLSGPLTLAGGPAQALHAATKLYVDSQAQGLLSTTGGTLSGSLTLAGDPAQPLQAATRRYVDAATASNSSALAVEASTRGLAIAALQASVSANQTAMSSAQSIAAAAQSSASTAVTNATNAQTTANSALATATAAQGLANAALPTAGGSLTGNLSLSTSYVYAGTDDFSAVRLLGRPNDGRAMLYVNKVGSSATDPNLIASYYYVNDVGGTGAPRLVNNFQANVVTTLVAGIWLTRLGITSASVGGNQGLNGHLAADMQAIRSGATPIGNTTVLAALSTPGSILSVGNLANFAQAPITGGPDAGKLTSLANAVAVTTATTAASAAGATSVLQVASTAGIIPGMFCWSTNVAAYVVSTTSNTITLSGSFAGAVQRGASVYAGWSLLVKVGRNFYHLVSTSATSGAGMMTFAEAIAVADATVGKPVVSAQGGAPLWSFVAEIEDQTGLSSSASGFSQIGELDISGNGDDDGPNAFVYNPISGGNLPQGGRCFLSFVASKYSAIGPDFVMNAGLAFTTAGGASINSAFLTNLSFNSAILDARSAIAASAKANAIWLADGHRLALSSDGTVNIAYDPVRAALVVSGQTRFSTPPILPGYTVASLPPAFPPGAKAYVTNARKNTEPVGAGTGVEVFADASGRWISVLTGTQVQA